MEFPSHKESRRQPSEQRAGWMRGNSEVHELGLLDCRLELIYLRISRPEDRRASAELPPQTSSASHIGGH